MRFFNRTFLCFALISSFAVTATAQTSSLTHAITSQRHMPPQLGRDFWVSPILLDTVTGTYYNLTIGASKQTNVYIQMPGAATKVLSVGANQIAAFNIPISWILKSSSVVEQKGIHVWSNDADLTCNLMSHAPFTSDGMYLIPTIGWDTTYVVAAYNALYEGGGTYVFDEPSEMSIVADQDNTVCTIMPSTDIRIATSFGKCATCLGHAKGIPFTEYLSKGQAVQYMSISATDAENFDLTGTIVHSNKPVGVVGGAMNTNVPMGYGYSDHMCEMMPPVKSWGTTYISAPFYPANPGKQWSSFLVIGTYANQVIYRSDPLVGYTQYCILGAPYSTYLRDDIDQPSKWESSGPFLLVQYINSSTYPDGVNSQGDPAEVVINPVEQWSKSVTFQTAGALGDQSPYKNYVNILVVDNAAKSTLFDGQSILKQTHLQVDYYYSVYRIGGVTAGLHTVTSDSAVGVYAYGYGNNESYAWSGGIGNSTFNSADTIPPVAFASSSGCYSGHVALLDNGKSQSMLSYIRMDSVYNMTYTRDPNWLDGAGINSSYYDTRVVDSSKPAYLKISVFDKAGNVTTVVSTYQVQLAVIGPHSNNFGLGDLTGTKPIILYDTITNVGAVPFTIDFIRLVEGKSNSGFQIDSAITTPLAVGEKRLIKISFVPREPGIFYDTIQFGSSCSMQTAFVTGSANGTNYRLGRYDFGAVTLGDSAVNPDTKGIMNIEVFNLSQALPITIDSVWADSGEFRFLGTVPFNVAPMSDTVIHFSFTPRYRDSAVSLWHATSHTLGWDGLPLGERSTLLRGSTLLVLQGVEQSSAEIFSPGIVSIPGSHGFHTVLPTRWTGLVKLDISDLLGKQVFAASFDASTPVTFTLDDVPSGVYFYRISCGGESATGKVVIDK